ncbi:uncharacterized protein C8A04DRAFT_39455 [Dichotomopilus funicola]|uniref:Thymocyte nuclear protein 1 n=1 Tax=Dichotomopilus funicola TaxID=1934379 RepID=A0AAN6ZKK8_9PEZI|nr:hypothetical protein C8A04DRAFT_39455 [Dichotomopilus funicola]
MPKRKSSTTENLVPETGQRRSRRLQTSAENSRTGLQQEVEVDSAEASVKKTGAKRVTKKENKNTEPPSKKPRGAPLKEGSPTSDGPQEQAKGSDGNAPTEGGRNYWLLKAEPESRFENGVDVKFSIDDLAARTEPEPWDGIRAYAARNNLRAMKKGELAFFYHSNCKEPGIVGTMEIVKEHSPDLSAHDPKAPYYDPKSKPDDPKWSVVHVVFRSKFASPIGLKELREMGGGPGKPLENMQMLKQSRLSVSRVSEKEWEYLIGIAEGKTA